MKEDYVKVLKDHLRKLLSGETEKIMINFNGSTSCVIIPRTKYDFYIKKEGLKREKKEIRPSEFTKSQKTLLKVAHKIPIFDRLNTQEIIQITNHVRFLRFEKDEALMQYNQSGKEVYFVLEGEFSVQVPTNDEQEYKEVATIGKGTILGEIAPVANQKRTATVLALSESAIVLSFMVDFENKNVECETYRKVNKNFINILAQKLVNSNSK